MAHARSSTNPNACANCGSLNTKRSGKRLRCFDCGQIAEGAEIIEAGEVKFHYTLELRDGEDREIWSHALDVLFEAQCQIAEGLGIPPGQSFGKWLASKQGRNGAIEDAAVIDELYQITGKILSHKQFIKDAHDVKVVQALRKALPNATRLVLVGV
jgi:hypothetical protein